MKATNSQTYFGENLDYFSKTGSDKLKSIQESCYITLCIYLNKTLKENSSIELEFPFEYSLVLPRLKQYEESEHIFYSLDSKNRILKISKNSPSERTGF